MTQTPLLQHDEPAPGARPSAGRTALLGALVLAAGLLGAAAAQRGAASSTGLLVAVVLACLLPSLVRRPRLVLSGLVVLTISHGSLQLAALGLPRPYVLALLLAVATAAVGLRNGQLRRPQGAAVWWMAALLAVQLVPAALARDPALAVEAVQGLVVGAAALVVVAVLASAPRGLQVLVGTTVATAAVIAAVTVLHAVLLPGQVDVLGLSRQQAAALGSALPRYAGPVGDANFWGRELVLVLPLALACAAASRGLRRAVSGGAAVLLAAAVLLTGSRGTFLAAAAAVVLWLWLTGPGTRRLLWLLPAALVLLLAVPGVGSRLASLTAPQAGLGTDPSLTGRANALSHGTQMALDHPLVGVGPGNFLLEVPAYQRTAGDGSAPLEPHNLYVQQAAEAGLPGLLALSGLLLAALLTATRALRQARAAAARAPGVPQERRTALPAALCAAITGWSLAGLFLHLADLDTFALVVAAAVVLRPAAADGLPSEEPAPAAADLRGVATAGVALGVLTLALLVLPWRQTVHLGEFSVAVTAAGATPTPYALDVGTRPEVAATLAQVLRSGASDSRPVAGSGVARTVLVAPGSSSIAVEVSSPSARTTAEATASAFEGAQRLGLAADAEYVLSSRGLAPRLSSAQEVRPAVLGGAAALALLGAAATAHLLRRAGGGV